MRKKLAIPILILLTICLYGNRPGLGQGPPPQPAPRIYDEMRLVYLTNLERRAAGLPPLRWNVHLTDAARWFSWDTVENRASPYCGHQDTLGRSPWERALAFGYQGFSGAENVVCGYTTPEHALQLWMDSPGHRANILSTGSREMGAGYYQRASDGQGYITQDLGRDPVYPPLVIADEALHTSSPGVSLYVYDREESDGFAGLGAATDMMVSNDAAFGAASWEPFANEKSWSLEPGSGWRTVYVKTQDAIGRVTVVSDTIYLGQSAPLDELGLQLASTATDRVTVYGLDGGGLPYVQFSQDWFVDDIHPNFALLWGNGARVNDAAALGGTAFRLSPGAGDSSAWVWTTEFFKDTPFVAYFRLKVSDNSSSGEVARVSAKGGGVTYGPLGLAGTDFAAADAYQTFPVAFTFHTNPGDVFLFFQFERSGQADVYVDGVYIFSAPMPLQSPFVWTVPGGNYRGGGVWLRYTDDAGTFSPVETADLIPERIAVSPPSLSFIAEQGATLLPPSVLTVGQSGDDAFTWSVDDDAGWLQAQPLGETILVSVDASGLISGAYQAAVTVTAEAGVLGSPVQVPIMLLVSDRVYPVYLPLVLRSPGP